MTVINEFLESAIDPEITETETSSTISYQGTDIALSVNSDFNGSVYILLIDGDSEDEMFDANNFGNDREHLKSEIDDWIRKRT